MNFFIVILILAVCWTCVPAQKNGGTLQDGSKQNKSRRQKSPFPRAVILTTDIGAEMDDQWTLAQLAVAPEFDLRAIVTTHAPSLQNPAAETAARVAREVLDHLPLKKHPPVFAGSSVPLAERSAPQPNRAVEFIIEQSKSFSSGRRLAVLMTGAATDVASALLIDPTLADRIEIVAMGFENWEAGGDSWNVKNDVRAWQIVLESRAVLTVGDARVTRRDLAVTRAEARKLLGTRGIAGRYLADLHGAWLDRDPPFVEKVTGSRDKWIIWDSVTLAYLLGLTKNKTYPRPILRDDLSFEHSSSAKKSATLNWVTAINAKKLWRHFTTNLDRINAPVNFNLFHSSDNDGHKNRSIRADAKNF
ncbi:MAG: nucleoside hydrolase [Acidobacteriota bacterium]|nr:nucleoside hydrolase [Acidobacteriota bacterium]